MKRSLACECGSLVSRIIYDNEKHSTSLTCSTCGATPPRVVHPEEGPIEPAVMLVWSIEEESDD